MSHPDSVSAVAAPQISATVDRRRFLTHAGLATLGVAGLVGASKLHAVNGPLAPAPGEIVDKKATANDINLLNFALNLEYLEAEYYLRAAYGRGLAASDVTGTEGLGQVTGGSAVPFATASIRDFAQEIARDEEAHVKFLRSVLGAQAVARPDINLRESFSAAAREAGLIDFGQTFNPYADEVSFLLGAFIFEDLGVTAYKGAIRLLTDKTIVDAAAGLLAVEAYHAATVRTLLYQLGQYTATKAISDLRDRIDDRLGDLDQPIRLQGHANIVPTDANGLAFGRRVDQVLGVVYLGGDEGDFGFFPSRVNGPPQFS
jgi:rubrerythrin